MDQKRLMLAIAISIAILLAFQFILPQPPSRGQQAEQVTKTTPAAEVPRSAFDPAAPGTQPVTIPPPREVPRLAIAAPRVQGSVSLVGARIDDLVLRDYHVEVEPSSPLVRVLEPRADPQPFWAQFGWTSDTPGVRLPDNDTLWTATSGPVSPGSPATLTWDNGAGLTFAIELAIDENYMFTARQTVRNAGGAPVALRPWSRIRREYKPVVAGYFILHEGMIGVWSGRLQEMGYDDAKKKGEPRGGLALDAATTGGWVGITDKYWLTALVPDQGVEVAASFRHQAENGADRYQVDFLQRNAAEVAPGAEAGTTTRLFAGAKEVSLLDRYEREFAIPSFDKAVDFGWLPWLTKPIFYALDWLYTATGNFGVAILIFTVFAKGVFFPLANKSYKSMSKMKLLAPKMTEMRERLKDDPAKMQQEMMQLYKAEKVNPVSGCLPMLVQIPVFFALYKVIFITIEMRHAPFFGWIKDLSAVDPTNVFNLFGLIPFDPAVITPLLHLGIWPLIMGVTMYFQQKLNPPPPDPVQARIFQFMPIVFTFMLASFPAGLVIYWSWNNLLTIAQQWLIMRQTRLENPRMAQAGS